jgi:putative membrane protein
MSIPLSSLPATNAALNAVAAVLLVRGYFCIRNGKIAYHRACMVSAFVVSSVFLVGYLYYHFHAGLVRFSGQGLVRPVYFALLTSHTILAVATPVLAIITITLALRKKFQAHRRIARWTLPIWLYVSVTGVIVYYMVYVIYTPIYTQR